MKRHFRFPISLANVSLAGIICVLGAAPAGAPPVTATMAPGLTGSVDGSLVTPAGVEVAEAGYPVTLYLPLVMVLGHVTPTPASPAVISTPALSAVVGQAFTVTVTISTSAMSRGAQFRLQFDPTVLRCEGVDEGDFYQAWARAHGGSTSQIPRASCDNVNGVTSDFAVTVIGGDQGAGASGAGALAAARFTALAAGESPLTLAGVKVLDAAYPVNQSLPVGISSGRVTVTSAHPRWDVNGDHVVDISDLSLVGLHWGQTGAPGWIPEDVNEDGLVDIIDVSIVGMHWGETW